MFIETLSGILIIDILERDDDIINEGLKFISHQNIISAVVLWGLVGWQDFALTAIYKVTSHNRTGGTIRSEHGTDHRQIKYLQF